MSLRRRYNWKVLSLIFVFMVLLTLLQIGQTSKVYAATISNDTINKMVTMTGTNYTMKFNYNQKAVVTNFVVNTHETLDPAQGIYSAVNKGSWVTTQSLSTNPTVTVAGNVVTAALATSVANEIWTFTVNNDNVQFKLNRTYLTAGSIAQQGTPMINFAEGSFDNMRWLGDGGNFPLGGSLLNTYQSSWLATGANLNTNIYAAKEQMSYVMLDAASANAL